MMLFVVHTHFEWKEHGYANFPTGYSFGWVPLDIMSYPFYDLYSHEPNTGELLSKIVVYEFEHITKKGRMCVIIISFFSRVSCDQTCSKTPQFVTNMMDI